MPLNMMMAEKVGFEPTRPLTNPNDLANRPLEPLEYFSGLKSFFLITAMQQRIGFPVAERVGFEPTAPCGVTGFQDQLLKPLGHLSSMSSTITKNYW